MAPSRPDFQDLKRRVSIERVLGERGLLRTLAVSTHKIVGPCPLHRGDSRTAFVVSRSRNLWHCFTGCRAGGDVIDLVRKLDDVGYAEAGRTIARLAGTELLPPPAPVVFRPFTASLALNPDTPFLREKGIRPETAATFQSGLYRGRGFLQGCVAVRLHDANGDPLGYAGRTLDPDRARRFGKWRLPAALPKRSLLFNYHRVRHRLGEGLALVEDPWSVMRLSQAGLPAAAMLGTTLSPQQHTLLATAAAILLLLDGDEAGRTATPAIRAQLLADGHLVVTATLPENTDPDQLTDIELHTLWDGFAALRQRV